MAENDVVENGRSDSELEGNQLVQLGGPGRDAMSLRAVSHSEGAFHSLERDRLGVLLLRDLKAPGDDEVLADDRLEGKLNLGKDLPVVLQLGVVNKGATLAVGWLLARRRILERFDDGLGNGSAWSAYGTAGTYRLARSIVPYNQGQRCIELERLACSAGVEGPYATIW